MWCMTCFCTPHHPKCPNAPEPPVAFVCDKCDTPVFEDEVEDVGCYKAPDGRIICCTCVDTMSTRQVLEYLGCVATRFVA